MVRKSGSFCNNVESLKTFLKADSCIQFNGDNIIKYLKDDKSNVLEVEVSIKSGENPSTDERYFHLELNCKDDKEIDKFAQFSEKIKLNLKKIDFESARINTLWDDVGRHYAIKAYPLINEIENLMRKLISQFMLINVGMDWTNIAIHDEIKEKIQKKNKSVEPLIDDLHKTDFIHLSDVLFKKYRTIDIEELNRKLSSAEKNSQVDFNEIKGFLLKSNWERHFSSKLDFKEESLKNKWEMLYQLRNKVAHNTFLTKADFNKILGLVRNLKTVINSSINKLEEIQLKEEEKESVISSYTPSSMALTAYLVETFVAEWYRKRYGDIELASSVMERDSMYDWIVPLKDGRKIKVIVKYRRNFYASEIRQIIRKTSVILGTDVDENHIVFVIDDISKKNYMNLELGGYVNKTTKVILGYIGPENDFIPIST